MVHDTTLYCKKLNSLPRFSYIEPAGQDPLLAELPVPLLLTQLMYATKGNVLPLLYGFSERTLNHTGQFSRYV